MEIDDVKALWRESNRRLDASMRLNTALLQRANLGGAATPLRAFAWGIAVELAVNVGAIVLLGLFVAENLHEPRFLIPAAALDLYAIALVVAGARQLAAIERLDLDEPVVTIQMQLERLKIRRTRTVLATLLFAPLMWVPLLIVTMRGLWGVDLYADGAAWLAANALFGFAVIPLAVFVASRYGPRLRQSTALRAFADEIAGRTLSRALRSLDAIRRFEGE